MRFPTLLVAILASTVASITHADLRVAAAVSMKEALVSVGENFTRDSGEKVTFTFGASGQLAAQIKGGAPIDLFISAASAQVDDLIKANAVDATTRTVIARNALVLIVPAGASSDIKSFADLAKAKRISLGEPKTVPAGEYAMQTLEASKLADLLKDKLIFAANVRQVLDLVIRAEVDAGLVYATDARQAGDKVTLIATADETLHDPIEYPAVIVKEAANAPSARRFIEYLKSPAAQAILAGKGFLAPTK
jgi:molybdate transport system substrate-binding protein